MTDQYRLACSTKAKRALLVSEVEKLAAKYGATVVLESSLDPHETTITVRYGPFHCMMNFAGRSRVGAFLGHWHTASFSQAHYPVSFDSWIDGSLNTFHYGKATTCEEDFDGLLESLEGGLQCLSGTAFLPQPLAA